MEEEEKEYRSHHPLYHSKNVMAYEEEDIRKGTTCPQAVNHCALF